MVFEIQVLDLKNWTWSRVETKVVTESQETSSPATLTHCAGHSLVCILTIFFFFGFLALIYQRQG